MVIALIRLLILTAILVVCVLTRMEIIAEEIFLLTIIGAALIAIIDYYWLGGKLNKEGRHYGSK